SERREGSPRIRGKGLTHLHSPQFNELARSPCCLFADPRRSHGELSVAKNLPPRPNLDHLRSQAKALLAALQSGDADAIATIREHLTAANGMSEEQIRKAPFRLAAAPSAVARKTGCASWPQLPRPLHPPPPLQGTLAFPHPP